LQPNKKAECLDVANTDLSTRKFKREPSATAGRIREKVILVTTYHDLQNAGP
jgi:hypothetical protein